MSKGEVDHMAAGLRHLMVPQLSPFSRVDGQVVGAMFGLPDYNPRFARSTAGLFPTGPVPPPHAKRNRIKRIRLISTNVIPEYQTDGSGPGAGQRHRAQGALRRGVQEAEFSWVLGIQFAFAGLAKRPRTNSPRPIGSTTSTSRPPAHQQPRWHSPEDGQPGAAGQQESRAAAAGDPPRGKAAASLCTSSSASPCRSMPTTRTGCRRWERRSEGSSIAVTHPLLPARRGRSSSGPAGRRAAGPHPGPATTATTISNSRPTSATSACSRCTERSADGPRPCSHAAAGWLPGPRPHEASWDPSTTRSTTPADC